MFAGIMECFTNPVKCKMLLEINVKGQLTAKELAESCGDIPQTSLYRHLKSMTESRIIKVVDEHQIRGTVEKVYAMADDLSASVKKMIEENNGQAYMLLFTQYMMGVMQEFKAYTAHEDIDILNDGSGFSLAPVYVTREELIAAMHQIGDILTRLVSNESTPERSLHNIGMIITPPKRPD